MEIQKNYFPGIKELIILISSYFVLRLLFVNFPELKVLYFIYPTGEFVSSFLGLGIFNGYEWVYEVAETKFILGQSCSGTTFFSLLFAYMIMKFNSVKLSAWWLLACYPISIVTNTSRVLCSVYVYNYTQNSFFRSTQEEIHLFVGVVIFFITFFVFTLFVERKVLEKYFDKQDC